jgi:trigger factor
MYGKTETVTRPIETGDFVMIDLKGTKNKAAEGEPPVIDRPGMPIFIRPEAKEDEWPYPGFSNELIGASPDESKSFEHKFPKDHADESLKGETVQFEVKVKMVRGTTLPELNDEFAKTVGAFENLEALRGAVRANLMTQSRSEYDTDYFNQLVDKIGEGATVKYPPQVLDHEVEHVLEDLQGRLAEQKMDLETYFKVRETTREKFVEEEAKPVAIKRMTRSLILDEIVRQEKLEVSEELLNATFQQTWGEFRYSEDFQKLMRGKTKPPKRLIDAVAMQSANRALTELTLTRLKEIATGQAGGAKEDKPKKAAASSKGKKAAPKATAEKKPAAKSGDKKPSAKSGTATSSPKAKKPASKPAPEGK